MASGTEATDDWCENQCAAYGCEEDAQKVCELGLGLGLTRTRTRTRTLTLILTLTLT